MAAPLYGLIAGHDAGSSSMLVVAVAIACMIWSPLHNTAFDWLEWRFRSRVASDRPNGLRLLHAISQEVTSIVVTSPVIMLVGGHSFWHALVVDIGLTILYTIYGYFFHILYDWMRPVQLPAREKNTVHVPLAAQAKPVRSRSDEGVQAPRSSWHDSWPTKTWPL